MSKKQKTLSGDSKQLKKPCSHYGVGYEKGCTNDATRRVDVKIYGYHITTDVCESCAKEITAGADKVHEDRPLHDMEMMTDD